MIDYKGQHLGNYRLMRLLGTGGMASVYLAEHVHLGTHAAIKVLSPRLQRDDLKRFLTEARMIARLEHPYIVRVLEFGVEGDLSFLAMSYAPGGSLRQLHPAGTVLPLDTVVSYVKQVAQALQYAHDQHVIHRDIKPENMLLGQRSELLLSDFGLAVLSQSADAQQVLQAAGTLAYMAPEQIQGHPTPASDQYALGIVVYEWLCGKRPFRGSLAEIASQHLSAPPPRLREQVPTLPSAVEDVVLQTLSKDPSERFATVHALALALEKSYRETSSGQTQPELSSAYVTGNRSSRLQILPTPLTSLLGREKEIAEACALLRRPEVRLVTLTGTAGIGKTRLALHLATELMGDFADGVCFVSLAPITAPDLVLPSIAQALGLKETDGRSWLDLLHTFLQHKQYLLLLDNFEQVVMAAPPLVTLLQKCPGLNVLVTSRSLLHVAGEHHFPVTPLSVPDLQHLPEDAALVAYAAVALFVHRAQALKPDFRLTPTNARAVAEICVRLDGLPLAIELAAARIPLFSPQALLARLGQRFAMLTRGGQDAPARQQTLRNTIAWSYDLLNAYEQSLFCRLAAFVGGCALEAIEAVCSELDDGAGEVLEGVASLIDKNLLQQGEQEDGEPRFVMLETNREYGLEALSSSGEMEAVRQVHAAYYHALAQQAAPHLTGPLQAEWLERLEQEHDNLHATLTWSLEPAQAGPHFEMALQLGVALSGFWDVRGFYSEGRTFLERALAHSEGVASPTRARALSTAAEFATEQSDFDRAEALCQESLVLYRELGDTRGSAFCLQMLAVIAANKGVHYAVVRALLEEGLALHRELGDKEAIAGSFLCLADIASAQGDYSTGRAMFEEGLTIYRELGNKRFIAASLKQSGTWLFFAGGDQVTVRARLEESLTLFRELGDKQGMAFYFWISGWLALSHGETLTAHALVEQSLALWREMQDRWRVTWAVATLGRIEAHRGDLSAARALNEESLARVSEFTDNWLRSFCLEGLASVVAAQGEEVWAAQLWGVAESLRERCGIPLTPVERADYEPAVAAARTHLGEQAFAAAWAEGRSMTFDQVLTERGRAAAAATISAVPPAIPPTKQSHTYPSGLTARELEVLRLVAQGLTDAQVAEQLVISPRTVNWHLTSIYSKLQVASRSAATRYAIEQHLI
ncbi:MAG: protein kinase domain-containing protein [Ktedonobacteraceae bacterium]